MASESLRLFAVGATRSFGEAVAAALGVPPGEHEERDFEDGEHRIRPLQNVRGRDVFVIHSLYGDADQTVNDELVRLLFLLGAMRDAAAGRVTAVIPYPCYARKGRKTKPRYPVSTRYLAGMLEAVGVDRVLTMDVHNPAAYQNAFRCGTDHLEARKLFMDHLAAGLGDEELVVASPDVGASSGRRICVRRWAGGWAAPRTTPSWRSGAAPGWSAARRWWARCGARPHSSSTT